jgi:hypothetical protein
MKYSIRLFVAILTFIIGATAAHYLRGTHMTGLTVAPSRQGRTIIPPKAVNRSTLSVCELPPYTTGGGQMRVRGTVANFEMDAPKIFDLNCESKTMEVFCSSKNPECRNIFADLKAAEAASVKMELIVEYVGPRLDEDREENRLRIDRVIEIGPVSFPFEADTPYPAISGRRNKPAKKPAFLKGLPPHFTALSSPK